MAGAPGQILVVDDTATNRLLLSRLLERQGYQVTCASDGRQALELLHASPVEAFDIVLLDIMMPEMDGYQTLAAIKQDIALRHIPVIMITAVDELDSVIRCIELGAVDHLPKPFNPVLLQARIGACLDNKRLRDQEIQHLATIEYQAAELAAWNQTLEQRVQTQVGELERLSRLRRFLSPQLAEVIASTGNERMLESHRTEITVVFCDLRGFTAFAESVEPEELMQVLREYHTVLGELIFQYEATLERFAGDGIMIFFNDPVPCADPAARSVRMAVEMRERVGTLQRRWHLSGYELGFGVGIAIGYATCGRIGFEGRYDYGAIGTVTNMAARLCGEAADGQILISGRVYAAVEEQIEAEEVGALTLKGFRRPVPAYNVLKQRQPAADVLA